MSDAGAARAPFGAPMVMADRIYVLIAVSFATLLVLTNIIGQKLFLWFDQTIGRNHVDDDSERALEEEWKTLAALNVMFWLKKFPHWHLVATFVEQKPMGALERVHRTVAVVNKGLKDGSSKLDRYINTKRKQKTWNTLVYGAPTPHDARYPETMPVDDA